MQTIIANNVSFLQHDFIIEGFGLCSLYFKILIIDTETKIQQQLFLDKVVMEEEKKSVNFEKTELIS